MSPTPVRLRTRRAARAWSPISDGIAKLPEG